jgi:NAD(P)-dependent dehydrogenase (short-subunit alcohol dehydrogenase family)
MINMTRGLARTLAPTIRVNAVAPGFVDTPWWERRGGLAPEQVNALRDAVAADTPLQVAAQPEHIASAVTWLVAGADVVTGECVLVDAGAHLAQGPSRR